MKNKTNKILSLILALVLVFSACLCMFTPIAAATEKTYYVSSGGNDANTGTSRRNALETVEKAIELANAEGLGEGDIVTLKVLNTTGVKWSNSASPIILPSHTFKLVITSDNTDGSGIVGTGDKNVNFGGDVDFKNVNVSFGNGYHNICSNGHNITFDARCKYLGNVAMSYYMIGAWRDDQVYNNEVNFYTEMPIGRIGLSNFYSKATFNDDVNVRYNALSGSPVFWFGSDNATTTYNAALNITINASSAQFTKRNGNVAFGENGYVQVINHTAVSLKTTDTGLSAIPAEKLWVLNNTLRASDLITTTNTKGKFAVNTNVYSEIKAVSVDDPSEVINEVGGYLTLPAGAYTITASKIPQEATYYVKDGGTGDGSQDNPIGSVADAITKAVADGYIVKDKVTVKVMGTSAPMGGNLPAYPFDLTIDSADPAVRPRLDPTTVIANGQGALTTYKNVELYREGTWKSFHMSGSDVIFEASCKFTTSYLELAYGVSNGLQGRVPGQTVIMNCNTPHNVFLSNHVYADRTYTEPVTFILNNPDASPGIYFNAYHSGPSGTTVYEKTLNIGLYSANTPKFANIGGVTFKEALQIINGSAATFDRSNDVLSNVPADMLYILNNVSGDSKLLEFTDTVGKYKVNLVNPEHRVVFENMATGEKTYYDNSGYITVLPGDYKVSIERDPYFVEYFVDPEEGIEITAGSRPEGAGTKKMPVKTFADATRLISQDGLSKIDVATVRLKEGVRNYWKNETEGEATYNLAPANYSCTVILDSYMGEDPAELYSYSLFTLSGDLVMRNVDFSVGYTWADCTLNGHDLTIEEGSTLTCPYLQTWKTEYGKVHSDDQTVTINGILNTNGIYLSAPYHSHRSTGDFNFFFNNVNSAASFVFGPRREAAGPNVYEGNININVKQAKALAISTSEYGANITGSLQMLIDDSVLLPYSVKTNFEALDVPGGKWYITNAASDDDFISFIGKGKLSVKNGAKAYSRQLGKDLVTHTGGEIDLSAAPGAYTISNKSIKPLTDDSHKMLYFFTGSTSRFLGTRARVTPGETYQFEYTIFNSFYADCSPKIRDDSDRGVTCDIEIVSEKKIGDCYKIVAKGTIPEDYSYTYAFFGVQLNSYSEGILFDRTVYNVKDETKKDCYEGNQFLHDGLDYVTLDFAFWGKIFTDKRGGTGLVRWQSGLDILEVMTYDLDKIAEIKNLSNPNDGEWWDKGDIKEEADVSGVATVKGTFKDIDGNPIPNKKFMLVSDEDSFTSTTNSKGEFSFKNVPTSYYDLYLVIGSEQYLTQFGTFLFAGDIVTFDIVNYVDNSSSDGLLGEGDATENDETVEGGENIEEITPPAAGGTLKGIVYSAYGDPIAKLKVSLGNVGEVVTDENGSFELAGIPAGVYDLCVVKSNGEKVVIRKDIEIKDNITRSIKAQYDISLDSDSEETDNGWILWVIIASIVALVIVAGLIFLLVFKKKKIEKA